jgi:hypothetical protein
MLTQSNSAHARSFRVLTIFRLVSALGSLNKSMLCTIIVASSAEFLATYNV